MKTSQKTRFPSLVLALVLSFSLCPAALADLDPSDYSDVSEDHWAYDSMMYCSEWEIVKGFEDCTFRPEDQVTYAQFIAMLARTFYADEVSAVTDITGNPWYYPYMKVACDHKLHFKTNIVNLGGWPEVVVADDPVNRYEMASILRMILVAYQKTSRYDQLEPIKSSIKDYDQIPTRDDTQIYDLAVPVCYYVGVLTGMSDGKFHGEQTMTRAQACVVITRMKDVINSETPSQPQQPTQPETPPQPQQPETPQQTTTGTLANGQPATVENVWAILEEIKEKYPTGTSWGDPDIVGETNYYADGDKVSDARSLIGTWANTTYACGGWATMVSNRIFGMTGAPTREVTDVTKAHPGDIVIEFGSDGRASHVSIFLRYESAHTAYGINIKPAIHTCDGNSNGEVYWDKCDGSCSGKILHGGLSDFGTHIRIFTRYPD